MLRAKRSIHQSRLSTQRSFRFVFSTVAALLILVIEPFGLSITFGQSASKRGGPTEIRAASVNARRLGPFDPPIDPDDDGSTPPGSERLPGPKPFDGTLTSPPAPNLIADGVGTDVSPSELLDESCVLLENQQLVTNYVLQAARQERDAARSAWSRFSFGMGALTVISIGTVGLLAWARNRRRCGARPI
jgi:hypothetical protein